jgi:AraC family transcriptional regulator
MASEGSDINRAEAVANVASRLFGTPIGPESVIDESLRRATDDRLNRQGSANPKYPNSTLLGSLNAFDSSNISAELRSHRSCEGPGLQGNNVEVAITVDGSTEGMVTCKVDGKYQRVRPSSGTIWLVPTGAESEEISIASPELQVLHLFLPNATFLRLNSEYALPHSPSQQIRYSSVTCDQVIEQVGSSILSEMTNPSSAGRMLTETASLFLAARLLQAHSDEEVARRPIPKQRLDDVRLKRVLAHIEDRLFADITVADLADVACLSMFHFTRAFTAVMGLPPNRYVSRRRLEAAKEMISGGRRSLIEIALSCQFSSQSSFTRAFRRSTGLTPAEYRQQSRK